MKSFDLLAVVRTHRHSVGLVAVSMVVVAYAALHWINLQKWIEERPSLAAWVQAVFSVVAIFVAIWTAQSAARENRRRAEDERLEDFDAVSGLATHALKVVASAHDRCKEPTPMFGATTDPNRHSLASVRDAQQALAEIPVLSIPGGGAVVGDVMAIRRLLAEAETVLQANGLDRAQVPVRLQKLVMRAEFAAIRIAQAAAGARASR